MSIFRVAIHRVLATSLLHLFLGFWVTLPAAWAAPLVINPARDSYDTQPVMVRLPDGSSWTAWKSYARSREKILARRIGPGETPELGPMVELSDEPGVVDAPQLIARGEALWAVWASRTDERWQIVARPHRDGQWRPAQVLSGPAANAIKPRAALGDGGRLAVAWQDMGDDGRSRIVLRAGEGEAWSEPVVVSDGRHDAFRPVLVEAGGIVWAVWDEYRKFGYAVFARPVLPALGAIEQVSPAGRATDRCFTPVALASPQHGLVVAWLKLTDVIGGQGVIDQWHTLQMAVRREGRWVLAEDGAGGGDPAWLIYGLLSDLEQRGYPSGYVGRRRHPLLVEAGGAIWLLWEQKSVHEGTALKTPGQLIGRAWSNGIWSETRLVHEGLLDYRLASPARAESKDSSEVWLLASEIPNAAWARPYHRFRVNLARATPIEIPNWAGQFEPVDLRDEKPVPRHQITLDQQTYNLYWADLHCHSGLTADAEGEPDEIVLYGRDRARLDVMVLQDNDEIYHCFLTESEYLLGALHSQFYSRSGRFLALPGYEWTQRVPKEESRDSFRPFEPVYHQRGTFPNHRTVVYPLSGGPIVRYPEVGGQFERLMAAVKKAGGVVHAQHQVFCPTDHALDPNMEIATGWAIYLHQNTAHFHGLLDDGRRVGFLGASDTHRRNPGLCGGISGIYARSLEPEAIIEALRERRVFATTGSMIVVEARANGHFTHRDVKAPDGRVTLDLHTRGTAPIVSARLIRAGQTVATFPGKGGTTLNASHRETLPPGTHWYYWQIEQEGNSTHYRGNTSVARGHYAWSSPHFVVVEP